MDNPVMPSEANQLFIHCTYMKQNSKVASDDIHK